MNKKVKSLIVCDTITGKMIKVEGKRSMKIMKLLVDINNLFCEPPVELLGTVKGVIKLLNSNKEHFKLRAKSSKNLLRASKNYLRQSEKNKLSKGDLINYLSELNRFMKPFTDLMLEGKPFYDLTRMNDYIRVK